MDWLGASDAPCSINIFDRPLLQMRDRSGRLGCESVVVGGWRPRVVVSDNPGSSASPRLPCAGSHAERHVRLMPASISSIFWSWSARRSGCFYRSLKLWKQSPSPGGERVFGQQFDKIFGLRTGYKDLDGFCGAAQG